MTLEGLAHELSDLADGMAITMQDSISTSRRTSRAQRMSTSVGQRLTKGLGAEQASVNFQSYGTPYPPLPTSPTTQRRRARQRQQEQLQQQKGLSSTSSPQLSTMTRDKLSPASHVRRSRSARLSRQSHSIASK
eukprot:m.351410 g.351410  ORF g.351410 m.351410 type:complete len:134 (-) comp16241_c0_seq1:5236-5637(-)